MTYFISMMKHISAIINEDTPMSSYKGSEKTYEMVKEQVRERWGDEEAERYSPYLLCRTFNQWLKIGFRVRKGEKALRSVTVVEKRDEKGVLIRSYPKKINLFMDTQVEKIEV